MHRAASLQGAGRTPTGNSRFPAPKFPIPNRNFSRLETRVTHRKHSPASNSNRNFRSTISRHAWRTWGSQFWLRNHNSGTVNCGRTRVAHGTLHTPFPECGSEATAPLPNTTQLQRSLAMRPAIGFAAGTVAPTIVYAGGYLTNPISNRSAPRLEMPESYTKQRTDTLSNRHNFTQQTATPPWTSRFSHPTLFMFASRNHVEGLPLPQRAAEKSTEPIARNVAERRHAERVVPARQNGRFDGQPFSANGTDELL